jgi:hypothetical protein
LWPPASEIVGSDLYSLKVELLGGLPNDGGTSNNLKLEVGMNRVQNFKEAYKKSSCIPGIRVHFICTIVPYTSSVIEREY